MPSLVETLKESLEDSYIKDSLAPSIVIPAPSAAEELVAPEATTIFLSSTVNVVELMVVVVPST